ncbi:MAG: hypothetical protein P8Y64_11130 [Gammaproteobacteria bacterium]
MKAFFLLWWRSLPFTVGMAASLIALCFLVRFYDYGLELDSEYIWLFMLFFLVGFPTLIFGIKKLSHDPDEETSGG